MLRCSALPLLAMSSALAAAPVPEELKRKGLEGTWKLVAVNDAGKPLAVTSGQHWTIDAAGRLTSHYGDPLAGDKSIIRLVVDPRMKTLEYEITDGRDITYPGRYVTDGDALEICCNYNGGSRPTAVESGRDLYLWTLKRVKVEAKK